LVVSKLRAVTVRHQPAEQSIEQRNDAMLQQDVTGPEADDMDLVLSVDNISNNSLPEKAILSYLGGYVAHKLQQSSLCFDYVQLLTDTSSACYSGPDTKVVELKSWGRLKVPSLAPMKLLEFLEQCVQKHAAKPCVDIYTDIPNEALASEQLAVSMIGSSVHASTLTAKCVHFCIVTRLLFLQRACNRNRGSNQEKNKLSKLS